MTPESHKYFLHTSNYSQFRRIHQFFMAPTYLSNVRFFAVGMSLGMKMSAASDVEYPGSSTMCSCDLM